MTISQGYRIELNEFSHCSLSASFDVSLCETLPAAVRTILANAREGTERQTLPSDREERIFEVIEDLRDHPEKMFKYLITNFTEIYDIDLIVIGYREGKFVQINAEAQETLPTKPKQAFLLFNRDNSVCGPLFTTHVDGSIQAAFPCNCPSAKLYSYMYLAYLNDPGESFHCSFQFISFQLIFNHRQKRSNCPQPGSPVR